MGELRKLNLGNGKTIYIEVDDAEADFEEIGTAKQQDGIPDLPEGAELTGAKAKLDEAAAVIQSNIDAVASMVYDSLEAYKPDEWGVELHFAFKGKAGLPVLVSGEVEGGIKVSAKWTRK